MHGQANAKDGAGKGGDFIPIDERGFARRIFAGFIGHTFGLLRAVLLAPKVFLCGAGFFILHALLFGLKLFLLTRGAGFERRKMNDFLAVFFLLWFIAVLHCGFFPCCCALFLARLGGARQGDNLKETAEAKGSIVAFGLCVREDRF